MPPDWNLHRVFCSSCDRGRSGTVSVSISGLGGVLFKRLCPECLQKYKLRSLAIGVIYTCPVACVI